jgi:hypothetical protein
VVIQVLQSAGRTPSGLYRPEEEMQIRGGGGLRGRYIASSVQTLMTDMTSTRSGRPNWLVKADLVPSYTVLSCISESVSCLVLFAAFPGLSDAIVLRAY